MRSTPVPVRMLVGAMAVLMAAALAGCTTRPVPGDLLRVHDSGGSCTRAICPIDVTIRADGSWLVARGTPASTYSGTLDPTVLAELTRRINAEIGSLLLLPSCGGPCRLAIDQGSTTLTFTGPSYAVTVSNTTQVVYYSDLVTYARSVSSSLSHPPPS
jgi:hypothetical protein